MWSITRNSFFRRDIAVIFLVTALKRAVTVFTRLPFRTLWPNWPFFGHSKKSSVNDRKKTKKTQTFTRCWLSAQDSFSTTTPTLVPLLVYTTLKPTYLLRMFYVYFKANETQTAIPPVVYLATHPLYQVHQADAGRVIPAVLPPHATPPPPALPASFSASPVFLTPPSTPLIGEKIAASYYYVTMRLCWVATRLCLSAEWNS